MGVGLADHEVVAVEHLGKQKGGEVQLKGAITPAAVNTLVGEGGGGEAGGAETTRECDGRVSEERWGYTVCGNEGTMCVEMRRDGGTVSGYEQRLRKTDRDGDLGSDKRDWGERQSMQ